MKSLFISVAVCLSAACGFAQNIQLDIKTNAAQNYSPGLSKQFENYTRFSLDTRAIYQQLNTNTAAPLRIKFNVPGLAVLETELNAVDLLSEDFRTIIQTEEGLQVDRQRPAINTYQGKISGYQNSKVALTISEDFISCFFDLGDGNKYYIEPVIPYEPSASKDVFVLYNSRDVLESGIPQTSLAQGVEEYSKGKAPVEVTNVSSSPCSPKLMEYGVANDYQMVVRFGNNMGAVLNHDIALMNAVRTNFDDEFKLGMKLTALYVPSCNGCDPWPWTPDPLLLYIKFADWVNAGGFGTASIDWALLLTPREINGNISGFTFPNGMCDYYRVSLVINYTNTLCTLQKHVSHNLGTSFGATETATGIMGPDGSCTNDWEQISRVQIGSAISAKPCLSPCVAQPPGIPFHLSCVQPGTPECRILNYPCIGSYIFSTDDPTLSVTMNGNIICFETSVPGERYSHVYVAVTDLCGNMSSLGVSWTIHIDCQNPERDNDDAIEHNAELTVTQINDVVIIDDHADVPEQKLIRIFDMNGKLMLKQTDASALIQIPLQALLAGLYVVHVNTGEKDVVKKFTITR